VKGGVVACGGNANANGVMTGCVEDAVPDYPGCCSPHIAVTRGIASPDRQIVDRQCKRAIGEAIDRVQTDASDKVFNMISNRTPIETYEASGIDELRGQRALVVEHGDKVASNVGGTCLGVTNGVGRRVATEATSESGAGNEHAIRWRVVGSCVARITSYIAVRGKREPNAATRSLAGYYQRWSN
jgi:hypothetical protein